MEKAPKDLLDYLEKMRRSGKYNMITEAHEVIRGYVDEPASVEGIQYLFKSMEEINVGNYTNALDQIGKK